MWTEADNRETETNRERMSEKRQTEKRKSEKGFGLEGEREQLERGAEKSSPFSESVISRLRVYRKNPVN